MKYKFIGGSYCGDFIKVKLEGRFPQEGVELGEKRKFEKVGYYNCSSGIEEKIPLETYVREIVYGAYEKTFFFYRLYGMDLNDAFSILFNNKKE